MQLKIQRSQRVGGVLGNTVFFCLDVRAAYTPDEAGNINKYKIGSEIIYRSADAKKHLERMSGHLDRTDSNSLRDQASGLARGALSLAMAKMNLNISISSLARGHHIECKDLNELAEAEETVMEACRNIRNYLKLAASFNGSTILVDFSDKDEQVHTAMAGEVYAPLPAATGAPQLVGPATAVDAVFEEVPSSRPKANFAPGTVGAEFSAGDPLVKVLGQQWATFQAREDSTKILLLAGVALVMAIFLYAIASATTATIILLLLGAVVYFNRRSWLG